MTVSVSFNLLSRQFLNLEIIPSSQRQNDNGDLYSFWFLVDVDSLNKISGMHRVDAVFRNVYLLEQKYCKLFQKCSKRP